MRQWRRLSVYARRDGRLRRVLFKRQNASPTRVNCGESSSRWEFLHSMCGRWRLEGSRRIACNAMFIDVMLEYHTWPFRHQNASLQCCTKANSNIQSSASSPDSSSAIRSMTGSRPHQVVGLTCTIIAPDTSQLYSRALPNPS